MSKHTPGPWSTDEADHDEPYQDIKIKAGKHRTICTVWIDDAPVRDFNSEQTINARLIAAAPELLAALEELDEAYCRAGTPLTRDERTQDRKRLIAARAAIAKAKGLTK